MYAHKAVVCCVCVQKGGTTTNCVSCAPACFFLRIVRDKIQIYLAYIYSKYITDIDVSRTENPIKQVDTN